MLYIDVAFDSGDDEVGILLEDSEDVLG